MGSGEQKAGGGQDGSGGYDGGEETAGRWGVGWGLEGSRQVGGSRQMGGRMGGGGQQLAK